MVTRKVVALGRQRDALERALAALATGPEHAALVESCRGLADQLDGLPAFDDRLWREYRLALRALHDRATDGDKRDDFDAELQAMRTEMGNTAKP